MSTVVQAYQFALDPTPGQDDAGVAAEGHHNAADGHAFGARRDRLRPPMRSVASAVTDWVCGERCGWAVGAGRFLP
jgi:hypothetical protein